MKNEQFHALIVCELQVSKPQKIDFPNTFNEQAFGDCKRNKWLHALR